ncbi:MAG: PAN domain-containing protein [Hyphomonadaceae bacterium]|nr:PAN domain-containing protein [Hyphomonadaceae bacterium]
MARFGFARVIAFALSTFIVGTALPASAQDAPVAHNVDRPGGDYTSFDLATGGWEACRQACHEDGQCRAYTYVRPGVQSASARCWLKNTVPPPVQNGCCISGISGRSDGVGGSVGAQMGGQAPRPSYAQRDNPPIARPAASCQSGFVWREAFDGDTVCVPPETRAQTWNDNAQAGARVAPGAAPNCLSGYVWREARDGDVVCVTPQTRAQVAQDNRLAASRVAGASTAPRPSFEQRSNPPIVGSAAPRPAQQPVRNDGACRQYATGAVRDFEQAQARPRCRIGPDGRWHADFNAHYDWCVRVSREARSSEYSARDRHLLGCGARFTY